MAKLSTPMFPLCFQRLALCLALIALSTAATAQDFQLYFANNVTDVTDYEKIETEQSGLNWREVKNGDIAGNQAEVETIKQMFASTDMKGDTERLQYWKMRDHALLCFRLGDGNGKIGSFNVEVTDGNGVVKTLTASRYFYTNAPRLDKPLEVRVWRVGEEKNSGIYFRYYVYDWDNDNLYLFQLDEKRQISGKSYKIEYVTTSFNDIGDMQTETKQLDLSLRSFQSFYLKEGSTLQDLFLMSGEDRLRINLSRLITGTTPYSRYDVTTLTPTFVLSKHEGRELVNFNWLGSGLYEQFDTLFISLVSNTGGMISKATLNVERVDESGHRVADATMKYLGYDTKRKVHMVLTYGRPCYIEILANNYLPIVYKYAGASDPITHIVSEDLCNATVTLVRGKIDESGYAIASQQFSALNDNRFLVTKDGETYLYCSEDLLDLASKVPTDTVLYSETAGSDYPKLFNNVPTERYAQLVVAYSRPNTGNSSKTTVRFVETVSGKTHEATPQQEEVISVSEFPSFTRNYYFQRYNLVGVIPENNCCKALLYSEAYSFDKFPMFFNLHINHEEEKKRAEDEANNKYGSDQSDDIFGGMADCGWNLSVPLTLKFKVSPFKVTSSIVADLRHQLINYKLSALYIPSGGNNDDDGDDDEKTEEEKKLEELRKEVKTASEYGYVANDDSTRYANITNTSIPLGDAVSKAAEDIFTIDPFVGTTWYGGFKLGLKLPFSSATPSGNPTLILTEASGLLGWKFNMAFPNLADKYLGTGVIGKILKFLSGWFQIGGQFGASIEANIGIKNFGGNESMTNENMGYFVNVGAQAKGGMWVQFAIPNNPLLTGEAGVRAGAKVGVRAGLAGPFAKYTPAMGFELALFGIVEGFINVRTPLFQWSGKANFHLGGVGYWPKNGHNPFHPDFPYWLKKTSAQAVGNAYKAPLATTDVTTPSALLSNIAIDANPHFLDETHVVVNDLSAPTDYNDDCITVVNTNDNTTEKISATDFAAHNHMRSKRGSHEVVVFEQATTKIDNAAVNEDTAAALNNDLVNHKQIVSAFRNSDGSWKTIPVNTDDGFANTKPVVTIQEDGKAACVWQRGISETFVPVTPADTLYPYELSGNLVLATFDGTAWSDPTPLLALNHDMSVEQYDLIMRNDSVLVACNRLAHPHDSLNREMSMCYYSKVIGNNTVSTINETFRPKRFFMNRVGHHGVIAILYEKPDSLLDIYVKTIEMDGRNEGCVGSDIGANYCSISRIKIICDREAEDIDDFALLWTETNNAVRQDDGSLVGLDKMRGMLNASRIHLGGNALHVTAPITLGVDQQDLIITDFDGVLDDARIRAVYLLSDPESGGAVLMTNEKYFRNSFESDVTYSREQLVNTNLLPVSVTVFNTGTSAIESVSVTLNGQLFDIDNSYVAPMNRQTFIVQYPIDSDFDGYISSSVSVRYDNVFRAKAHPLKKSLSFESQVSKVNTSRVPISESIEMNLIGRSIEVGENSFTVELIDHSMRGLDKDNEIIVGIFAHPKETEPLSSKAVAHIRPSDFQFVGGKRKAFATISIEGISEPTQAFINMHIVDTAEETPETAQIDNTFGQDNAYSIKLYPTDNPTDLERIINDKQNHRITIEELPNGVLLSGLENNEHIRVFDILGRCRFSKHSTAASLFVPLSEKGVYLLTGSNEVFKFVF